MAGDPSADDRAGSNIHDAMKEGGRQSDLPSDRDIQPPHNRERHNQHQTPRDDIWHRHVSCEGHDVNTFASRYGSIPCKFNWMTREDDDQAVDDADSNNNDTNQV